MADVRTLASDADIAGFLFCRQTGFLGGGPLDEATVQWCRAHWLLDRAWAAFDDDDDGDGDGGGTLCGTARTFPSRLRLPGLADVAVSCLSSVTVLPTHTRRGHLTRLMRAQLEHAVDAGEAASLLVAAEWPIYGRFGYGLATEFVEWEVDTAYATVTGAPVGRCQLVDVATFDKAVTAVLARQQAVTPGAIERPAWLTAAVTGAEPRPGEAPTPARVRVVHVDDHGEPDAFAMYDPTDRWDGMRSACSVRVVDAAAVDDVAERELWRYLLDIDWVERVAWPKGSPTSVVRWVLGDGRAARQEGRWDFHWARILDVPTCLTARAYPAADRLVVEVVDDVVGRGGRFALDATPDGATCEATTASADLTLSMGALSGPWLGGTDLRRLAAGGGIDEHTAGAVDRLARLLRWHQDPWCPTDF